MPERVRITFYLPVTRVSDQTAYLRTMDHVRSLQPGDGVHRGGLSIDGYTVSVDDPVAFGGWYWSAGHGMWLRDDIVLLIIDFEPAIYDETAVRDLKRRIERFYADEGAEQEELYCTVERVSRL